MNKNTFFDLLILTKSFSNSGYSESWLNFPTFLENAYENRKRLLSYFSFIYHDKEHFKYGKNVETQALEIIENYKTKKEILVKSFPWYNSNDFTKITLLDHDTEVIFDMLPYFHSCFGNDFEMKRSFVYSEYFEDVKILIQRKDENHHEVNDLISALEENTQTLLDTLSK